MTMNRVQFQPGHSMAEFMDRYGSNDKCEAALVESRWPAGFACPSCGCDQSNSFRREGLLYFLCAMCRHQCSVISGTIFEATKLPLTRWFLAMHLLTQSKNNVAALELMRHLGVCYKTAWLMKHKLMEVMRVREDGRQLDGRVEIDDAHLGGERSGGKTGRGSENKVPFIAAVQTTPDGQPQFACLSQQPLTSEEVAVFAARSIAPSATVVSDGLWCFGASVQSISVWSPAVARPAPSWRNSARSTLSWATSSEPSVAPITPSTSPSTLIVTSLRPSIDSTVASICAPSCRACCALPASLNPPPLRPFVWLRFVANQDGS